MDLSGLKKEEIFKVLRNLIVELQRTDVITSQDLIDQLEFDGAPKELIEALKEEGAFDI